MAPCVSFSPRNSKQESVNARLWERRRLVRAYLGQDLRPPEAAILAAYGEALAGSVLEVGSGGGRITRHLANLSESVHGIDISRHMTAAASQRVPEATFEVRDMQTVGELDGAYDGVVAGFNVLDVLGHAARMRTMAAIRDLLKPGGLFIFSTHNLAAESHITDPMRLDARNPKRLAITLLRLPRWKFNRRRLQPFEERNDGYAVLNDLGHQFDCLHYYVDYEREARDLADLGLDLLACFDLSGAQLAPGEVAPDSTELHYVARVPADSRS